MDGCSTEKGARLSLDRLRTAGCLAECESLPPRGSQNRPRIRELCTPPGRRKTAEGLALRVDSITSELPVRIACRLLRASSRGRHSQMLM
jgi:hypothetical protein